jgi:LmbE family N-acetylglucosaminyl deacetylase
MQIQNIHTTHRRYDHVYVSPHFDDVAASCSGRILKQIQGGESVLVVTVFTARATQQPVNTSRALSAILDYDRRRSEDNRAMQRLGVDFVWLEVPEVLFRFHPPWMRYWPSFRATPNNRRLCKQVTRRLEEICRQTACTTMVLPLGVGQHMDHQILYQAGLKLLDGHGHDARIVFFEEIPYAIFSFLLIYRLKKTGIWQSMRQALHGQPMDIHRLSSIEQIRLIASMSTLGMHQRFLKPVVFLMVAWLDIVTRFLMRSSTDGLRHQHSMADIQDITPFIDQKLNVISAYSSQLSAARLSDRRIKSGLAVYAQTLGMPAGCFGERCWCVSYLNRAS